RHPRRADSRGGRREARRGAGAVQGRDRGEGDREGCQIAEEALSEGLSPQRHGGTERLCLRCTPSPCLCGEHHPSMIDLRPFRALRYDPATVGDLAEVIAPPYDVIDAAELERLYARSPHNVVRLILNRSPDRYAAAAAELAAWRGTGVLVQDRQPALY